MFARRSMAATQYNKNIYFFGGVGASGTESILDISSDFYCFDTQKLNWREIEQKNLWPSKRRCAGFTTAGKKIFLFGGSSIVKINNRDYTYNFLNDLWEYSIDRNIWKCIEKSDDNSISPLKNNKPIPRYTPVFQQLGDSLIIFSGYTEDKLGKRNLNDFWIYNNQKWEELNPFDKKEGYDFEANYPGIRYGCMSAVNEDKLYICGGFSDEGDHIDIWKFDISTKQWTILCPDASQNIPNKRYCASFGYFNNKLILFGGRQRKNPKANYNDLYEFDLTTKKWSEIYSNTKDDLYNDKADHPAYHAKSSFCVIDHFMYIWGGEGLHGHVSDFWRLNLDSYKWELLSSARDDDPKFW
jgi:N-acetylneuraminic acid mutarotase